MPGNSCRPGIEICPRTKFLLLTKDDHICFLEDVACIRGVRQQTQNIGEQASLGIHKLLANLFTVLVFAHNKFTPSYEGSTRACCDIRHNALPSP